jgi:FtsP/CotA-like multicopper oxidase with cupredoxin domain
VQPAVGAEVNQPEDLRSQNGVLKADLYFYRVTDPAGHARYCYVSGQGDPSPTLRVHPGDLLILKLHNEIVEVKSGSESGAAGAMQMGPPGGSGSSACTHGNFTAISTNLHFHGLAIAPTCHQDEVTSTSIGPSERFEYRFQIPTDQPPGLYWYHPHLHGFSKMQVLGGASGALIIEGAEKVDREIAGLPERVLVVRDQDLVNPKAQAQGDQSGAQPIIVDRDGDARNTGSGGGKPAKDLSLNFVPVPFPDYQPALISMQAGGRELWRVLNASAITYLSLQVLFDGKAQELGVTGLDGVPVNWNGSPTGVIWQNHLGLPPGGRVEFIVQAPAENVKASLVTRSVNTGADGENDPTRRIASIVLGNVNSAEELSRLPKAELVAAKAKEAVTEMPEWLGDVTPVRTRKIYFSEKASDPNDPNSPTTFFITVDGQTPKLFDPMHDGPALETQQGDVEDWIIENRSRELHAFHIHQVHFLLLQFFGIDVNEPFLRDTINVPFWDGRSPNYPSIKLRIDFRSPNIVGVFPIHCHLLEHEDGGMMALIRVKPKR